MSGAVRWGSGWWMGILAMACGSLGSMPDAVRDEGGPGDGEVLDSREVWEERSEESGEGTFGCDPGPFPESLEGTWAQVQVREAIVSSSSLADVHRTYTTLSLWRITGEGDRTTVRATVCSVETESPESPVKTIVPLALVRSLPPQELPCEARREGEGWRLIQDRHVEVRGAVLADPETDPLPTDPEDPSVVDQDRDGHPGVTVLLTGIVDGAVYVVQRIWTALEGCTDPSGGIRGVVFWGEDQVVLGSDNPILVMQSRISPIPGAGRFLMRRVSETTDCAAVIERRDEILGEGWRKR